MPDARRSCGTTARQSARNAGKEGHMAERAETRQRKKEGQVRRDRRTDKFEALGGGKESRQGEEAVAR